MRQYCVYIVTNKSNRVLYTGVTNDLRRRTYENKHKLVKGFTSRYNIMKLIYYDMTEDVHEAIKREKQIKAGSRKKKVDLIKGMNPEWRDLAQDLY